MPGEIPDPKSQIPDPKHLARITDNPALARVVPLLQPEVLHGVITHCGLQDCGELLTLVTPRQLSAVFDLDLWKTDHAGGDERFDPDRFCEWLAVLADEGAAFAAGRVAQMDHALVVAGLSPAIRVFDAAVFSPDGEPNGADAVANAGRERGLHADIGAFVVVARTPAAWAAIVEVLLALLEHHSETFHRVMRACCRLSNSGWELDGLDDLSPDSDQARFDLSASREQRRDRLGFLPPQQARAFLDAARRLRLTAEAPAGDHLVTAYQRAFGAAANDHRQERATDAVNANDAVDDKVSAVASLIEVLRESGVLADPPRALLPAAPDEHAPVHAALSRYLQLSTGSDDGWAARNQELAFLANALVAGCSVHGRPFERREAVDAVAATCNLGLEYWPPQWPAVPPDLVAVFQAGWSVLHREVVMATAAHLLRALDQIGSQDRDVQLELHALSRELRRHQRSGTPWRARSRLDVLAPLDLPVWAAVTALLDECPVMLANVRARGGRRPHTLDPAEFQFIAGAEHIAAVQQFLASLTDLLAR